MLPIDRTDEKKITTNGQSMQVNKKKRRIKMKEREKSNRKICITRIAIKSNCFLN